MKLENAIETLTEVSTEYPDQLWDEANEAIKLSIEALKRLIAWRNDNDEDLLWDLPGETTE